MTAYMLPKLASFTLSKYGEGPASSLALFWCRKLQFLYDVWCSQEKEGYEYSLADIEASNDYEGLAFGWESCPPEHPCWARLAEIEAIHPY